MKSLRTRVVGARLLSRATVAYRCMFHRISTWWRALFVVLLSLATVTWPSAAQALTTASFSVVHQDVVATVSSRGAARFSATIAVSPQTAHTRAVVALYPRLIERSQIDPVVSGQGVTGRPMSQSRAFNLNCAAKGTVKFTVDLYSKGPGRSKGPCGERAPQLRLTCSGQRCDGVYPLRYMVTINGVRTITWSLLVLRTTPVTQPIQVALIETLEPSAWVHAHRSISVLDAIAQHSSSAITLSADYRTLSHIQAATQLSSQFQGALDKALASPRHQIIDAPPSFIDFNGLATNGLSGEVHSQLSLSSGLLTTLTGRYVDGPVLLSGTPSTASVVALERAGVSEVVVPEQALTVAPSSTLAWGAPFRIEGVTSVTALVADGPLSALATNESIEPGLRSVLTLATLDFLHFEAPFASDSRTVVITAPVATTSVRFITDLLNGFSHNSFTKLTTLSPSFNSALIGTNGAPVTRALISTPTASRWTAHNVSSLASLISGVTSFASAVSSSNVGSSLRVAVATSEVMGSPDARQSTINAANSALGAQLAKFSVDPGAITLAGPGTSLPITLLSRANYTVTAEVHLITDRLSFPKGNNVPVVLDSPTKSFRIPTSSHLGSSLTLQVVVTTPDNQTVLAKAAIQVRIAGNSVVGYLLSLASILVLAYWWLRTYRRRSKGRHAR
jgi:hypothetical protein